MQVKDIMSSPVVTIGPEATVQEAANLMLQSNLSALVVVDESKHIVGILTHSDFGVQRKLLPLADNLYQLLGSWADPKAIEDIAEKVRVRLVKEVMTRDVEVVTEDVPIGEVVERMLKHRVNRLPVVRDKELVGIVTRHDLLKVIAANEGE
ncbi:MAG: CBS domain-containing protein [Chloroflexi bacterium]|nr:CBS domain-containing protein [Chloroflexota bacterium]MBI4198564.1 CBS domain-containing protein [Chloroflexota bacterium]